MSNEPNGNDVVDPLGRPTINPPEGGPNADPNTPDPGDLVPGRPGPPPDAEQSDADQDD
jgi:hypothetical protein